ncbi:MAG: hypothetical protein ACFNTU_00335 [Catonella sp.]|nr:MAG TPA: hypothetical protein [Caudoviricetes sp.]
MDRINDEFVKRLDFNSDTFDQIKTDMNFVLQRLLGNMVEKGSTEGGMTVKIDVDFVEEWIPNHNPETDGESRKVDKPKFKHKITSQVKISDEKSGNMNSEMELAFDKETGCYYMRPVMNTAQRSIFDDMNLQKDTEDEAIDSSQNLIEGSSVPFLPGPSDDLGMDIPPSEADIDDDYGYDEEQGN